VLYGAMGDFLFPNEGGIADVFERLVDDGAFVEPIQVVYRAHPRFQSPLEKMKRMHHVIPDRGATYFGDKLAGFEMEDADERHLINSLYHADVVVTAGSTFAMDAAVFDKPIVCVGLTGRRRTSGTGSPSNDPTTTIPTSRRSSRPAASALHMLRMHWRLMSIGI